MPVCVYTNNAFSTLAGGITSGATSLSVGSGHGARFPTLSGGDYTFITLTNTAGDVEIVKVTARSSDTMTIERAQDGTTARAWSAGDRVELRITRALLAAVLNERASLDSPAINSLRVKDTTGDHQYVIVVAELSGNRNISLPLLTADDVFVFADFIQTLKNKTLEGAVFTKGSTEAWYPIPSSTTPALSTANGNKQTWTLTGNSTPTIGTLNDGQHILLAIDDGSASTINWSSIGVTWKTDSGSAPTLNTTGRTFVLLENEGGTIYGWRSGNA